MTQNTYSFKLNKVSKVISNKFEDLSTFLRYHFEEPTTYTSDELYYFDENGVKRYTKKGQDAFYKVSKLDYLNTKNKLNGVDIIGQTLESVSLEKRGEIWNDLHGQLVKHINSLKKLYPYRDFSKIYQKANNIVFRIRYENTDFNIEADQFCNNQFPLIGIHIEPQYISDEHGLTGIRHEFTHFCCDSNDKNPNYVRNYLTIMPTILTEGCTQMVTNNVLVYEKFDKGCIDFAKSTYDVYTKIAEIYISLLGEKNVLDSYFEQNMKYINNAFLNVASRIPRYSKLIDSTFVERLNMDLTRLFFCTTRGVNAVDMKQNSIYDFPYFIKFLEFAYNIFDREPNYDVAMQNTDKINYILSSFDAFFKAKKANGEAVLR